MSDVRAFLNCLPVGTRLMVTIENHVGEEHAVWLGPFNGKEEQINVRLQSSWGLMDVAYITSAKLLVGDLPQAEHPGITALREVLKGLESQGGHSGYLGDGRWGFQGMSVGVATAEQLNAMFDLVKVKTIKIESYGGCSDCLHAKITGRMKRVERGYAVPCGGCMRPSMSNFESLPESGKRCAATRKINGLPVQCGCMEGHFPTSDHGAMHGGIWITWRPQMVLVNDIEREKDPMSGHVFHDCLIDGCFDEMPGRCIACEGGLGGCVVCDQWEADLQDRCPGPKESA